MARSLSAIKTFNCILVSAALISPSLHAQGSASKNRAITVFAGMVTDSTAGDVFAQLDFADSHLAVLAWNQTFSRSEGKPWSWEWEANLGKYWGDQDHWEANLALGGRWHRFPWNDTLNTSLAFGLGPSYASQVPPHEIARGGQSEKWLIYWYLELTLSPPGSDLAGVLRLHHRSDAYGLMGDTGSTNAVILGLRQAF